MPSKGTKNVSRRYVRDIDGERLKLTARRLVEIHSNPEHPVWFALNTDIKNAYVQGLRTITVYSREEELISVSVGFNEPPVYFYGNTDIRRIGCHDFSPAAFRRILQNAGVKTKKALAAKAGA